MVNDEKIDEYTHYLTWGLIVVLVIFFMIFFVELGVGFLTAISMGG